MVTHSGSRVCETGEDARQEMRSSLTPINKKANFELHNPSALRLKKQLRRERRRAEQDQILGDAQHWEDAELMFEVVYGGALGNLGA